MFFSKKKKKTTILIYISKYKISLHTKYQIMDFFYKIEKYLYFFIKKFIIKKKNQTFLKNIKLHTQKLLSQFLIRFPKKSSTTYSTNFFKKIFSKKKSKILIYISKYKISLYTKFSFYTHRCQNQPNLHDPQIFQKNQPHGFIPAGPVFLLDYYRI